jgi:hypothetical protein
LIIIIYVDELGITNNNIDLILRSKKEIVDEVGITNNKIDLILRSKKELVDSFDMTDLCILHYCLGLQVLQLSAGSFISQSKYVMDLLTHFKMEYCNSFSTPFQYGVNIINTCQTPQVDVTLY